MYLSGPGHQLGMKNEEKQGLMLALGTGCMTVLLTRIGNAEGMLSRGRSSSFLNTLYLKYICL